MLLRCNLYELLQGNYKFGKRCGLWEQEAPKQKMIILGRTTIY